MLLPVPCFPDQIGGVHRLAPSLSGVRLSAELDAKISLLEEWPEYAEPKERGHAGVGGDSESGLEGTIRKRQGWGTLSHHPPLCSACLLLGPSACSAPSPFSLFLPCLLFLEKKKKKKVEDAATVPQSKQIVLISSLDWRGLHGEL